MSDLYDRLRPADECLDAATADRVWARIVARHSTVGPHAEPLMRDMSPDLVRRTDSPVDRARSRHLAALLAAAAAVVGLVGTAVVVSNRDTVVAPVNAPSSTAPVATDPFGTAQTETTEDPLIGGNENPGGVVDLAGGTNFAIADYLPAGWELDSMRASAMGSLLGSTQWALVGDDGSVTGVVSVRAPRPVSAEEAAQISIDDYNTTVRGVPAFEYQQDSRTGLDWVEGSLQISLTATGEAERLARRVAEELVIDRATRSVTVPGDFGLVPATELDFADPGAVTTIIGMSPMQSTLGVVISSRPNTFGYELDQLAGSEFDWRSTRIADQETLVATTPGGSRQVAWLRDGLFVTVVSTTTLSDDDLDAIVRGVRFSDADEFRAIVAAKSAQQQADILSWDVFDRTTTPDGLDVTVRARPGGNGANAICVDAPEPACTILVSEGGAIDGFETYGAAGFAIDGAMIGVVWVSNDLEIQRPTQVQTPAESPNVFVRPSAFLNSSDGYADGTTATIVADTRTERGRFVVAAFPSGERPPTIQFAPESDSEDSTPAFELTSAIADAFSF